MTESEGRGPCFRELRPALEDLDREELEARLLDHARRPGEPGRGALLEALRRSLTVPDGESARGEARAGLSEGEGGLAEPSRTAAPSGDAEADDLASPPLLVKIDGFVERVQAGEYYGDRG